MRGRVYVMIFFFWALLAVITPTLVIWTESLKPFSQSEGSRRMMGHGEMHLGRELAPEMVEMGPSPAPSPEENAVSDGKNQSLVSLLQMTSKDEIQAR